MSPITHLNLEITNLCNQRCAYCFNGSGPAMKKAELPLQSWKRFLELQTAMGLRSVHITGGEPFVDGKSLQLIALAQHLKLRTSVLSNGYKVERLVKQFAAQFRQLSVVQISLDSATAAKHDARRGKAGAWRQAIAAIRALARERVPCEISCTVSRENLPDISRLADFCARWNFKLIVRPMLALGRGTDTALQPSNEETLVGTLSRIEAEHPDVMVRDRFHYVPSHRLSDAEARHKGIVTVLADGRFRSGTVLFPNMTRDFASVPDLLAAAA